MIYLVNALNGKRSIVRTTKILVDDEPLPIIHSDNVLMTAGEVCHYYTKATFIETKNIFVRYNGSGREVSNQERIPGMLTITNKRIIFSGSQSAFDKTITSLSSITPQKDRVLFQFGDKQYPLMLKEPKFVYQIVARVINTTEIGSPKFLGEIPNQLENNFVEQIKAKEIKN